MIILDKMFKNYYAGNIKVKGIKNPKRLYEHQSEMIKRLNKLSEEKDSFSTLVVIPTGGGKTLTAVWWLLRNAIDSNKKILWIAHRHMLLEQALDAFIANSCSDMLYNVKQYNYRIVSGKHDRSVNISPKDNLLIASKDSLNNGLSYLDPWLKKEDEVFLVIDEAHHSVARSYRKIIEYCNNKVKNLKIIGLTATPFRTNEGEQRYLTKIYKDDLGYDVTLTDLISRRILATPHFKELETNLNFGDDLNLNNIKDIERRGELPEDIAEHIAKNSIRNNRIVNEYMENRDKYKKLLVFAINRIHAIELNSIFQKNHIKSDFIISGTKNEFTGIDLSKEENEDKINKFRNDELDVLINVNILSEGSDIPEIDTIFLTRPTMSSILMTQMIGRGLRGKMSGGTESAAIVSFIDDWKDKIAWVNPEKLYGDSNIQDNSYENRERNIRMISINLLDQFVKIVDDSVDTSKLENMKFSNRIPVGLYAFSFIENENIESNYTILIYNNSKKHYEDFISSLNELFEMYNQSNNEIIDSDIIEKMCKEAEKQYFEGYDIIPPYNRNDIKAILKFYAFKGIEPTFIEFNEEDRQKVDLEKIAHYIYELALGGRAKRDYVNSLWEDEKSLLKLYFGNNKIFFKKQLDYEIIKLEEGEEISDIEDKKHNVEFENREIEKLTLYEICKQDNRLWRKIRDEVFERYKDKEGYYICPKTGYKSKSKVYFDIDHIKPISKGGLTTIDNLRILRRDINRGEGNRR